MSSLETLTEIKQLMERSSRFISLSGLSGVFAGLYALVGALAAYLRFHPYDLLQYDAENYRVNQADFYFLLADAALVVFFTVGTGIYLTTRKAKRDGSSLFDATAQKLIINLCIPLFAAGVFCFALVHHGHLGYVAPTMLIFYGLALINASKYTLSDVRLLGVVEMLLGLVALFMIGHGLLFWTIGFGAMHIVYGSYMYFKYEK